MIEEYAGLFQHLELGREGIERYIEYILQSLKEKFVGIEQLLNTGGTYEDTLVKLFRSTVKTYNEQQENITKEFGLIGNLELLQSLQHIVDIHAVNIIEKYCTEVARKNKSQVLCEEISKIIKHSESFEIYINKLSRELMKKITITSLGEKFSMETGLLKMSEIKAKILELANTYISLESQLMQDTVTSLVSKISITSYTEKNYSLTEVYNTGIIFEVIDEIFFSIQNAGTRGLGTFNINSICAILNNIATLISEELIEGLAKKFITSKVIWSTQFTSVNASIIVMLNLMTTCKKCVKKLVVNLDQQFNKIFGGGGNEVDMFKHCLASIGESEGKAKGIIDEFVENYLKSLQISNLLGRFRTISYDLTLELHSDYEVNDPFALKLVKDLKGILKQWKLQLIGEVFEEFIDILSRDLSLAIETELKNKKFNELGSLQFQKDLREIIGQLQHMSNKPIRYHFVKLKQISELLLAKDDQEIEILIKDSEWKLINRETQGFRRLRIA